MDEWGDDQDCRCPVPTHRCHDDVPIAVCPMGRTGHLSDSGMRMKLAQTFLNMTKRSSYQPELIWK